MSEPTKWSVDVVKDRKNSYRTVFRVDNQYFTIMCVEDDLEAEEVCIDMKRMFEKALSKLGVKADG